MYTVGACCILNASSFAFIVIPLGREVGFVVVLNLVLVPLIVPTVSTKVTVFAAIKEIDLSSFLANRFCTDAPDALVISITAFLELQVTDSVAYFTYYHARRVIAAHELLAEV